TALDPPQHLSGQGLRHPGGIPQSLPDTGGEMIRLVLHATARYLRLYVSRPSGQGIACDPAYLLGVPPLADQLQGPALTAQIGRLVEILDDGGIQLGREGAGKAEAGGLVHLARLAGKSDLRLTRSQPQLMTDGGVEPERVDTH